MKASQARFIGRGLRLALLMCGIVALAAGASDVFVSDLSLGVLPRDASQPGVQSVDVVERESAAASKPGVAADAVVVPAQTPDAAGGWTSSTQGSDVKNDKRTDKTKPPKGDPPVVPPDDPADPPVDPPVDPEPQTAPGVPVLTACTSGDMADTVAFEPAAQGGPVATFSLLRASAPDGTFSVVATAAPEARSFVFPVAECGAAYYAVSAEGPGGASAASEAAPNARVSIAGEVLPEGRTFRASNGEVSLALAPGSYPGPTTVTIEELPGTATGPFISLAGIYDIEPSGPLGAPATLSVAYSLEVEQAQIVDVLLRAAGLLTYDTATASWVRVADARVDGSYLTGELTHFSPYTNGTYQPHGTSGLAVNYCTGVCHDLAAPTNADIRLDARDSQVCYFCHGNEPHTATAKGIPGGRNIEAEFFDVLAQPLPAARTTHPVGQGLYCTSCHDPHKDPAVAGNQDLLRAYDAVSGAAITSGDGFCWTCHGIVRNRRVAANLAPFRPLGYDYFTATGGDHKTGYATSAHAGVNQNGSVSCANCHGPHGGAEDDLLPARQFSGCTGATGNACHSDPANAAGGSNIKAQLTAGGTNDLTHHDVDPAAQTRTGARIECTSCHNEHRDSASAPVSDPDNLQVSMTSTGPALLDSNGSAWLRVGAEHDEVVPVISAAVIVGGPTTYLTPTVSWTTNEGATSWVDWGLTAAYEQTAYGNNTLATAHSVPMTAPLTLGTTYYWRIRTTDALQNTAYYTGTYTATLPPLAPVMSDETTFTGGGYTTTASCELNASAVSANPPANGVQYQFALNGVPDGVWRATPLVTIALHTGTYTVQVQARDATYTYARSAWSVADTFVVENADPWTGSCPFLFSWDGDSFVYENEIYTTGKLGAPRANGTFQRPNPNDYCVLDTDLATSDGKLELRLVEEIYETDYLDEVRLYAIDVPVGQSVAAEKIPQGGNYEPIENIVHPVAADAQSLSAVHVQTGADVSAQLAESDDVYVTLTENKELPANQTIELDLGDLSGASAIKLLFEGATRFPRTEAGKLLGTAGVRQRVEVIGTDGNWVALSGEWPKPAEFERTYMLDLTGKFPTDDYRVRLTFLLKTYVDTIQLDTTPDVPLDVTELSLSSALLRHHGWDSHTSETDIYEFAYGEPNDSKGYFPGDYTRYGDVAQLLGATDDMFAIFGGGDEVVLRFDPAASVAEGMTRRYVLYANGYYKDLYSDVPKSVEPLPFAAMTNYPYGTSESYPVDAEHQAYRAEYNTRRYSFELEEQSTVSVMFVEVPSVLEMVFGDRVQSTATVAAQDTGADGTEDLYSIDTNQAYARVTLLDGSVVNSPLSAAWESASLLTAGPTPASPGTPVVAGRLPAASARDTSWLQTDITNTNLQANWQLLRFDMPVPTWSVKSVALVWYGHGEPTTGYETKVDVLNPTPGTWTQLRNALTPTDTEVITATSVSIGSSSVCLRCHDGSAPAGVEFPVTPVYTSVSDWGLLTGDYHGARVGGGSWWGTLRPGYTRGSQLACTTCHQTHGSASIYHFPSAIDGLPVATVTSGTNTAPLCEACHVGGLHAYHGGCDGCHGISDHGGDVRSLEIVLADCYDCHRHGASWSHVDTGCWTGCADGHGSSPPSTPRTF